MGVAASDRRPVLDELFGDDKDEQEWTVRINDQFTDKLSRMRRFDRDLAPNGHYRLNSGAFFFKLVRRNAATKSAGILLSLGHLGHLDQLMDGGELNGPAGGSGLATGVWTVSIFAATDS